MDPPKRRPGRPRAEPNSRPVLLKLGDVSDAHIEAIIAAGKATNRTDAVRVAVADYARRLKRTRA